MHTFADVRVTRFTIITPALSILMNSFTSEVLTVIVYHICKIRYNRNVSNTMNHIYSSLNIRKKGCVIY